MPLHADEGDDAAALELELELELDSASGGCKEARSIVVAGGHHRSCLPLQLLGLWDAGLGRKLSLVVRTVGPAQRR
jgi:hypothetical protein